MTPMQEVTHELVAPFPWFGGKRRAAPIVWDRFGCDAPNYVVSVWEAFREGSPGQRKPALNLCLCSLAGLIRTDGRLKLLISPGPRSPGLLCVAPRGPAALPSGGHKCRHASLLILRHMLGKVLRLADQLKVLNGVVECIAVDMVDTKASWDWAVSLLPGMSSPENPDVRFCHLDKCPLNSTTAVAGADRNRPDGILLLLPANELSFGVSHA